MSEETGSVGEGGEEQSWLTSVPEDIRGHEVFGGMEKAGDAYRKLIDLSENSKSMIRIPNDQSTDDEKSAYFKATGRPDEATGYTIGKPEGLPEDYLYDEGLEKVIREVGFKAGASDAMLKPVWEAAVKYGADANNKVNETLKQQDLDAENKLKDNWKGNFEANSEKAVRALKKFAGDDDFKSLADVGMDKDPIILHTFHKIFEAFGDDAFLKGDQTPQKKEIPRTASGTPMLDFSKSNMPEPS